MNLVLELFGGSGGASLGIHRALPDATVIGVEWWERACQTRAAAGLLTIRADVTTFPVAHLRGRLGGCWASPSCKLWSVAGHGTGSDAIGLFGTVLLDLCRGDDRRGWAWATAADALAEVIEERWTLKGRDFTAMDVVLQANAEASDAALVLEPARIAFEARPRWIVCEQVPTVAPLWDVFAHGLRSELGYSAWSGVLDAAAFGVPQNRKRAILMASLDREVVPPIPTHVPRGDARLAQDDLFGDTVQVERSMADALGWGATERPMVTVCSAGGGPDLLVSVGRARAARSTGNGGGCLD